MTHLRGRHCEKCPPGGKEMSLADENELEIIRTGMPSERMTPTATSRTGMRSSPRGKNPASLSNNRKAVEARFLSADKRLMKDPTWKEAYMSRLV